MSAPDSALYLVTGGSRGIGRAIASLLLERGNRVITVARQFDCVALPGETQVRADIVTEAGRARVMEAVATEGGRLDGLFNNAGRAWRASALDTDSAGFRDLLELNLLVPLELAKEAHSHLHASGGSIVNISSITSQTVLPDRLAYGATKAGLDHITRSLAVEWGPDGIRVNAVLPLFTRTEMVEKVLADPEFESRLIEATPLRRLAEPLDIARAAVFLAGPEAAFITGQTLAVDGGFLCVGL
jgi:NAD(P)-dependent dehydrogenase (short-subunit alcohol dehydrogenase family)